MLYGLGWVRVRVRFGVGLGLGFGLGMGLGLGVGLGLGLEKFLDSNIVPGLQQETAAAFRALALRATQNHTMWNGGNYKRNGRIYDDYCCQSEKNIYEKI